MRLRTKSWLVIVPALLVAVAAVVVVGESVADASATLDQEEALDRVLEDVSDLHTLTATYAVRRSERTRAQWRAVYDRLIDRLEASLPSEDPEELERLRENLRSAGELFGELERLDRDRTASSEPASAARARLEAVLLSQIAITLQGTVDDVNRWEARVSARLWSAFRRLGVASLVVVLILAGLMVGSGLSIHRIVLRPLERLQEGIERLTGEGSFRFGWERKDEIGDVAGAFDAMAADLEAQVAQQQETARQLGESEERFRQIAERIDSVFWISTPGRDEMEYVSPAYGDIWGRPPETLYESPLGWLGHIHPEDRERVRDALAEQAEGTYEEEYRIVRPDGEIRWIWDRAFPVEDGTGTVYRIIGVAEDITHRKELEEQLRHSQKMEAVGKLAGGIAHDFNNLLTVIRAETDLLQMEQAESGEQREEVGVIRDAADRAAELTTQLLAFSRKQVLRPRVLELNDIVRSVTGILRRVLGEDIRMETDLGEALPPIRIDPGQMEHVIMNLAVNARDAMPGGGTLTLATSVEDPGTGAVPGLGDHPGPLVRLDVADTGEGMDEETRTQIFEPFFTTKGKAGGTGLGLATVYGTVEQSGGTIRVESEPGVGTTFSLFFPAADGDAERLERRPDTKPGVKQVSGRVLVVEDDAAVRTVTRRILERGGLEVLTAGTAEAGLATLEEEDGGVDLVLTDLVLPEMSGRTLVDRVRERFPDLPLVVMSGYAEGSPGSRRDLPHEVAFIQKPFSPDRLMTVVAENLPAPG